MISTINISLPSKLKLAGDKLVEEGYYASFSDLVRAAIRNTMEVKYNLLAKQAVEDHLAGKSEVLSTAEDVDRYMKQFGK